MWAVTPFLTKNLAVRERRRRDVHLELIKNVLFPAVALGMRVQRVGLPAWEFCIMLFPRPRPLKGAATYFCCDQLVPLLRWCSQSVLSIDHGRQLGLNTTAPSASRQYWGHHPRFNLVCSTATCVRPSNRSPTGRTEPEARTVK